MEYGWEAWRGGRGSSAMMVTDEDNVVISDGDAMIITKPSRLWLSRKMMTSAMTTMTVEMETETETKTAEEEKEGTAWEEPEEEEEEGRMGENGRDDD